MLSCSCVLHSGQPLRSLMSSLRAVRSEGAWRSSVFGPPMDRAASIEFYMADAQCSECIVCLLPSVAQSSCSPSLSLPGNMVGVKRRTKDTILQATGRKTLRTNGLGNVRIDIQRSSLTFIEERGRLCNFLFTGPAFNKFLDTIRQDAPALLDAGGRARVARYVVTQWRVPL